MTDTRTTEVTGPAGQRPVMTRLSRLDRFLPVWIGAAMAAGLLLGRLVPGLNSALNRSRSTAPACRSRSGCC